MKIYEIQFNDGEKEWIAANTVIEALQVSSSFSDYDLSDYDKETDVVLFPEEKWDESWITDTDEQDDEGNDAKICTFKQWMKDNNKPDMIALTLGNL